MATSKPKEAILPKDMRDPTGVDALERRAMADMWRRLKKVLKVYKDALDRIPASPVVNAKYAFRLDAALLASLMAQFDFEVDQILLEGGEQRIWLFESYVTVAATQGIAQEYRNLARQSEVYRNQRGTVADILRSQPHVRRMNLVRTRVFEDMKGFNQAVKSDMARVLTDGIGRGLNPLEIARNLTQQIDIKRSRANTIARTEVTTALRRAAMDEADDAREELGIRTLEMHISALSATTRATHAARHGKLYTTDEEREWWSKDGNGINCFLPGTVVAGRFVAGSKARYKGPVVHLVTASGANLSLTTNHPVMTEFGLIPAKEVGKGFNLVAHFSQVKRAIGVCALNYEQADARIENVFGALAEFDNSFSRRVNAVDFHGDAAFMQENVEVVRANRVLSTGMNSSLGELLDNLALKHSDAKMRKRLSSFGFHLKAIGLAFSGSMRGRSSIFTKFCSMLSRAKCRCLRIISLAQSMCIQESNDANSRKPNIFADLLNRFSVNVPIPNFFNCVLIRNRSNRPDAHPMMDEPSKNCIVRSAVFDAKSLDLRAGNVFLDEVLEVRFGYFDGHVYDLEEKSGLMFANGIVTSNCKCSRTSVLVDSKNQPLVPEVIARAKAIKQKMEKRDYNWSKD